MIDAGDAAAFALWLGAAACARAAPDEVSVAFPGAIVDDWPGQVGGVGVSVVAGRLSASAPTSAVVLVLAVPGDPGALSAAPDVLRSATNQGACIALKPLDTLLIPTSRMDAPVDVALLGAIPRPQRWLAVPTETQGIHSPDRVEAERLLKSAIREAADELDRLDVAAGRDRVDPALLRRRELHLPDGVPGRRIALLDLALRIHAVLEAADRDVGAATSASAQDLRRESLRDLRRHVRRAIEAAAGSPSVAG